MKDILFTVFVIGLLARGFLFAASSSETNNDATGKQMTITIGQKTFTATLEDSATATAFKAMLPLKVNMRDLNDNEKVVALPSRLPTNDSNPAQIQTGDLMIWTSRELVLFYKSFPTSYSYTRLGRINDGTGLAAAVGAGNVSVSFELK